MPERESVAARVFSERVRRIVAEYNQDSRYDSLASHLLLSVPKAARALDIGEDYMRDLLHMGEIPVVRLGRRTLVSRESLEAFVARKVEEATPKQGIVT